ncbi:MAG: 3-hydroxyacyl-CoA dehydrogenase family protein [Deltaproteobacteria bacterium]|nr:3-hydroxyacyl-CoA dehydrogenase family protein [Deltaproteobacteria bacterium]
MKSIDTAVVVGAGTMGHGIAQVLAMAGIATTLVDVDDAVVQRGLARVKENLDKGVDKKKLEPAARDAAGARLRGSTAMAEALATADLLIEAIPERMEWKRKLFTDADAVMPAGALLASNTSSLSITAIARSTKRPEDVVGLHFFNPVHLMKLLEIVKGTLTSPATLQRAQDLATRLGKTAIVVNDAPGFATSRLGICLGNEAMRMLEEGVASASDIDQAMKLGYGHPMGPLALSDLVGLDVRMNITEGLFAELGTDGFRAPRLLKRLVTLGDVGQKSGRGFYVWENGETVGENPATRR